MDGSSFDWSAFSGVNESKSLNPNISSYLSNLSLESSSSGDGANSSAQLSLTMNQLSQEESNTYLRWYNDLMIRRHTKLIRVADVFDFLKNFNLSESLKSYLKGLFNFTSGLNIGQFFALLRLISHYIYNLTEFKQDTLPSRELLGQVCQIPKPRSILAKKRLETDPVELTELLPEAAKNPFAMALEGPESKIDLDSFAKFIMTGERPAANKSSVSPINKGKKKKKAKRVQFSDQLVTVSTSVEEQPDSTNGSSTDISMTEPKAVPSGNRNSLDLSLPMGQLLQKLKNNPTQKHQISVRRISDEEVKDEEELLGENFKHFQNVNIESALVHGKAAAIPQELVPTNTGGTLEVGEPAPLQANLTGSANHYIRSLAGFNGFDNQGQGLGGGLYNQNTGGLTSPNQPSGINYNFSQQLLNPGGISPNGLSPNNTSTGTMNNSSAIVSNAFNHPFSPAGSVSPNYLSLSPQPSGLPETNIAAQQHPLYQSYAHDQHLRASSLSPMPTSSLGDQFISSLTGSATNLLAPPPPPPRSRSSTLTGGSSLAVPQQKHNLSASDLPHLQLLQLLQPPQQYQYAQNQYQLPTPQLGGLYGNQQQVGNVIQGYNPGVVNQQYPNNNQDDLEWFERD